MAHFLCHYCTTNRPLSVDFIDFLALLYDKIRGACLGLCLQSEGSEKMISLSLFLFGIPLQQVTLNLAGDGLGKLIPEDDLAGILVRRGMLLHILLDFLLELL